MDKNSKIGILGAGVEGLAVAEYLAKHDYSNVTVFDSKENIEGVIPMGVNVSLGTDFFADADSSIYDYETLFRSPGIHFLKLEKAREAGIKVTSTMQFFFENCPGKIIGVTGTKGKGTTSSLIFEILKADGRDVYLGGNIGNSPLKFLDDMNDKSTAVIELSSFQLQDLTLSPQVAVVLMTTTDHMDYHSDVEEYQNAKEPIALFQRPKDFCVLNCDYAYCENFMKVGLGKKYLVSRHDGSKIVDGAFTRHEKIFFISAGKETFVMETNEVGLIGDHNLENVLAAVTVCMNLGVDMDAIRSAVKSFKGLEHRLQFIKEVKKINFYNDSFSTTPETSIAATYAFKNPVMLIAGGSEKNSDYTEWGYSLQKNKNLKSVFLIGEMANRMEKALNNAYKELTDAGAHKNEGLSIFPLIIYRCGSLEEAIKKAFETGIPGDNIVMSPAAASFDMFKNYKYRGAAFKEIVDNL